MEVRYVFLLPPNLEEILFSTPLIRSLIKSVEHAEVISAVPKQFGWVLENNPYVSSQLLYENTPSKHIKEFRDLNADYLVDLTGGKNVRWFKNRLRIMDFTFSYKTIKSFRGLKSTSDIFGSYLRAGLELLGVFDLEDDGGGIDYFYGHYKPFVEQALPESFLKNYAVLDMPEKMDSESDVIEKLSSLISMIERPVVLCGSGIWRKAGEAIMKNTGCTILSTCGDFTDQEQVFLRADAGVLINIERGKEIWALIFDKPHSYINIAEAPGSWKDEITSIRKILKQK